MGSGHVLVVGVVTLGTEMKSMCRFLDRRAERKPQGLIECSVIDSLFR